MQIDPDRAYTIAGLVVDAIADHYDGLGLPLPERRYVAPGLPAYDCPMLAVHVERIFPHDGNLGVESVPQLEGEAAFYMRGIALAVYLLRCVPPLNNDGTPPAADLEETAAADILRDPVHEWRAVLAALDAGDLPGCGGLAWQGWESVTPDGLLGGGVLRFLVSLE
jgi:hypothetical protein